MPRPHQRRPAGPRAHATYVPFSRLLTGASSHGASRRSGATACSHPHGREEMQQDLHVLGVASGSPAGGQAKGPPSAGPARVAATAIAPSSARLPRKKPRSLPQAALHVKTIMDSRMPSSPPALTRQHAAVFPLPFFPPILPPHPSPLLSFPPSLLQAAPPLAAACSSPPLRARRLPLALQPRLLQQRLMLPRRPPCRLLPLLRPLRSPAPAAAA